MAMNYEVIKEYWESRAAVDSSAQSTTQDVYLREIEFSVISEKISRYCPELVADIGCGDGRTTVRLAGRHQKSFFSGFDYASAMLDNARIVRDASGITNTEFYQLNICDGLTSRFNLIYTTRCLINLPSWDMQKIAIAKIYEALAIGGVYLMVENFIEGHARFNQIRIDFGLPDISIREHNLLFERQRLLEYIDKMFVVKEDINISSTYYIVSRIIYAKICAEAGVCPDYFDDHHRFAARLPFCGDYGPVRLLCLKKR